MYLLLLLKIITRLTLIFFVHRVLNNSYNTFDQIAGVLTLDLHDLRESNLSLNEGGKLREIDINVDKSHPCNTKLYCNRSVNSIMSP